MQKRLLDIANANEVVNQNNPVFYEDVNWLLQTVERYEKSLIEIIDYCDDNDLSDMQVCRRVRKYAKKAMENK